MSSLINIHEERHRLARKIFHGQRGQLRQRYREGQEDQLGALGLVLNAVVLWTTRYMDLALGQPRQAGYPVRDDLALTGGTGTYRDVGGDGRLVEFETPNQGSLTLHVLSLAH